MINLNNITFKAFSDIYELDKRYVGTDDYLGVAYFWNYDYRHYLRDTNNHRRKRVHDLFLREGLDVGGSSDKHLKIIQNIVNLS
jgi:hypothetical protein